MDGQGQTWWRQLRRQEQESEDDKLPRTLVAGLLLEVLLETPTWSDNPHVRRQQVKSRLRTSLVTYLAGHAPLRTFRTITENLETWFDLFYPLIAGDHGNAAGVFRLAEQTSPYLCPRGAAQSDDVGTELIRVHLDSLPDFLPRRRHGKVNRDKLLDFLRSTRGQWFRLADFQKFFGLDRKTAWEYVQKLIRAGLLRHNNGRSAAVRYRLADRFCQPQDRMPVARVAQLS